MLRTQREKKKFAVGGDGGEWYNLMALSKLKVIR